VPGQARFHPLRFAAELARDLNIREQTAALAYDGTGVQTNRGHIRAETLLVCTHFPIFNKHGSYFLKLYQERAYVLALEGAPPVGGMYLDAAGGLSFREAEGRLLLGGGSHRTGKQGAVGRCWRILPVGTTLTPALPTAGPRRIVCRWTACLISAGTAPPPAICLWPPGSTNGG
jgi:glycine/D-amino acid oxidase-like deaminating enzyme